MERTDMTDRYAALRKSIAEFEGAICRGDAAAESIAMRHIKEDAHPVMIAALLAERDALKADAERYRWLAENHVDYLPEGYNGCKYGRHDMLFRSDHSDLRSAIDAAMGEAK